LECQHHDEVRVHLGAALLDGLLEEIRHRLVVALNALEFANDFAISEIKDFMIQLIT
jgi:hypothetical protein